MSKKIVVKIDPYGRSVVEGEGFTGASCSDAAKAIERALGAGAGSSTSHKPEYYENAHLEEHEREY